MTRTQEALATSIRARAGTPDPDKPGKSDPGLRGRVALTILACMVEGVPPDSTLVRVAGDLPVHDGHAILGERATAVLDGIFLGQVDTATMVETFTVAVEADLSVMASKPVGHET